MSKNDKNTQQRLRTFEEFEKRLMMSADPVANLLPPMDVSLPRVSQQIETVEVASENIATTSQLTGGDLAASQQQLVPQGDLNQAVETLIETSATATSSPTTDAANIAAKYGFDGTGQTIAVIDTGIAWDHYALGGSFGEGSKVVGGWDFAENDADPYDDGPSGFHGTHVSGIIGSEDETYRGVSSGVDLVGLRVFDDNGGGNLEWVEQALQWVHDNKDSFENPITTVNLSLGTMWNSTNTPDWAMLEDEFAQLEMDGLFISVAAGNSFEDYNETGLSYPAVSPFVVPVASHGADNTISDFSQRDERVLAAPGESIQSTVPDHLFGGAKTGAFLGASGTSMAAPYVAGASAVLRQAYASIGYENVDQDTLYQQFRDTANQIYDSQTNGYYYQVNLDAAISSVVNGEANVPATEAPAEQPPAEEPEQAPAEQAPAQPPTTPPAQPPAEQIPGYASTLQNGQLIINGHDGSDSIRIDSTDHETVTVTHNGVSKSFALNSISEIVANGGGGSDSIEVNLGDGNDDIFISRGKVWGTSQYFSVVSNDIENVDVSSGGGSDLLTIVDTPDADLLEVGADHVTLNSGTQRSTGTGFSDVYTRSHGGYDTVAFVGSAGEDHFTSYNYRNTFNSGTSNVIVDNYSSVSFDGNGGLDYATLYGSDGNDSFELSPHNGYVVTTYSTLTITDVDNMHAISFSGYDTIQLNGSSGNDFYRWANHYGGLSGDGFVNIGQGFSDTTIISSGGYDVADIDDSAGNDRLTADGNQVTMVTPDDEFTTVGFYRVNVHAINGGYDIADLRGTSDTDYLFANQNGVTVGLHTGEVNYLENFEQSSYDGLGGNDFAVLAGSSSDETLMADHDKVEFQTMVQMLQMVNVETTEFDGNGGNDEVFFDDFAELDLLQSIGDKATAFLGDKTISAEEFSLLEARSVDDAIAQYDLEAVDYLYGLRGKWKAR